MFTNIALWISFFVFLFFSFSFPMCVLFSLCVSRHIHIYICIYERPSWIALWLFMRAKNWHSPFQQTNGIVCSHNVLCWLNRLSLCWINLCVYDRVLEYFVHVFGCCCVVSPSSNIKNIIRQCAKFIVGLRLIILWTVFAYTTINYKRNNDDSSNSVKQQPQQQK